jgi:hypothetical protein
MRILIIFILIIGSFEMYSQEYYPTQDSIEDAEVLDRFYAKTKFQLRLSHDRTLLTTGVNVKINTLKIGFQFKKHYKVGGTLFLSKTYTTQSELLPVGSSYSSNIVGYGAYFEYVILENYRYVVSVPFMVSRAWVGHLAYDENGNRTPSYDRLSSKFGLVSLGVTGGYSVNYWLVLSAGLGYRLSFSGNAEENKLLSTPFYSLGVKFKASQLFTSVFHRPDVLLLKREYFRGKNTWRAKKFKKNHSELF